MNPDMPDGDAEVTTEGARQDLDAAWLLLLKSFDKLK